MVPLPGGIVVGSGNARIARVLAFMTRMNSRYNDRHMPGAVVSTRARFANDQGITQITTNLRRKPIYHWYIDGEYAGSSSSNRYRFRLPAASQAHITCHPVRFPSWNGADYQRPEFVGRVTLSWTRSTDATIANYKAQYRISGGGSWTTFAQIKADGRWEYRSRTPVLNDDTVYDFQVVAVNTSGTEGTPLSLGSQRVVRVPDVIAISAAYNSGPQTITVSSTTLEA